MLYSTFVRTLMCQDLLIFWTFSYKHMINEGNLFKTDYEILSIFIEINKKKSHSLTGQTKLHPLLPFKESHSEIITGLSTEQIMANIRNQLIAGKNNITQFVDKAFCFFSSLILGKYFISHITFIPRTLKDKVMIDVHPLCQIKIKSNFLKDSSFTDINLILIRNSYSLHFSTSSYICKMY